MASIVEQCKISPHHKTIVESKSEFSLPVLFWDIMWYNLENRSLLFFKFACSKSHFIRIIVPDLKKSLSLTLSHFLSLAGNILHPLNKNNMPILRYVPGDSVSFKVCVSNKPNDFDQFVKNDPKSSDDLYPFAPTLNTTSDDDYISCSTLAIQVTLFPGHGICVGFVTHHAGVDARSVVCFMKAWSLINRNKRFDDDMEKQLVEGECMPFYDRSNVVEINGLDSFFCALVWICSAKSAPGNYFGNNVALLRAELKHGELKGDNGFVLATKAIGEAIKERVYSEKGILHGAEDWPNEYWNKLMGKRQYGVAGSPKFDFYETDFGWGKPKKFEALFLDDGDGHILISSSHEFEGGLEIGLSKPKAQMETFTAVFKNVLQNLMLH